MKSSSSPNPAGVCSRTVWTGSNVVSTAHIVEGGLRNALLGHSENNVELVNKIQIFRLRKKAFVRATLETFCVDNSQSSSSEGFASWWYWFDEWLSSERILNLTSWKVLPLPIPQGYALVLFEQEAMSSALHILWKEAWEMHSLAIVKTMLNLLTRSRSSDFERRLLWGRPWRPSVLTTVSPVVVKDSHLGDTGLMSDCRVNESWTWHLERGEPLGETHALGAPLSVLFLYDTSLFRG